MSSERAARENVSAGVYVRISHDRLGDELGVRRQLLDCQELAKQRGWKVTTEYVENDVSAFLGRRRPEYEAMLEAIRSGQLNAVIAWHPDRLYRHPRDLEVFVETIDR